MDQAGAGLRRAATHFTEGRKRPMFQTFSSLSVRSAAFSANSGSSLSTFFRFCAAARARGACGQRKLRPEREEGHD